jgi:thiamine kinase-like enzyme
LPGSLSIDPDFASARQLDGLTNRSYRIDDAGRSFVLRLAGPSTRLYIDRESEARHARAAHAAGLSPELLFADPQADLALYDYSPLPPVAGDTLRADPALQRRCSVALRRLHEQVTGFVTPFDPFERIDHYLAVLVHLGGSQPPQHAEALREVGALRAVVDAPPAATACHVDTYCENFLDDGSRTQLIDWEYSGVGNPMWDLANLSRENQLDAIADMHVLTSYFRTPPSPAQLARFELFKPICDLFWASWCLIQVAAGNDTSDWDADWRLRLDAAGRALSIDGFGTLLSRARAAD